MPFLFEAQQEYFMWANKVAMALPGTADAVPLPDFDRLENAVLTYRTDSLSPLPGSWYTMFNVSSPCRLGEVSDTSPRAQAGAAPTFNGEADSRLMHRSETSPFSSVTAMMEGHEVEIPKISGKEICLVWALKGKCSKSCKRKAQHKSYPHSVITQIHGLMDTCGVIPGN